MSWPVCPVPDYKRAYAALPFSLRTAAGLAVLAVGANIVGALVIALLFAASSASFGVEVVHQLQRVAGVLTLASAVIGTAVGAFVQRRTLRWLISGAAPAAADRRRVVRMPLDMAAIAGVLWCLDALVLAGTAAVRGVDAGRVVSIGVGIALAGLTSACVTYLVVLRVVQSVRQIVLQYFPPDGAHILSVRASLLVYWALTSAVPLLGVALIATSPSGHTAPMIIAVAIALVVGGAATVLTARAIGDPLRGLAAALRAVGAGDLTARVEVESAGEIGVLQAGVNAMAEGLQERDQIRDLFGRHVGPAVAEAALREGVTLSGEHRDVVALFVDISGSTEMAQRLPPSEFVAVLNRFFEIVVAEVEAAGGLVNKFEGDAALCIFGAPVDLPDAPAAGLRAARAIRDRVAELNEVDVGIGVTYGPVVAGQIGAATRLEYTVIGDTVNEAARLTELAKTLPARIAASEQVVRAAGGSEACRWTPDVPVVLRGRARPTTVFAA